MDSSVYTIIDDFSTGLMHAVIHFPVPFCCHPRHPSGKIPAIHPLRRFPVMSHLLIVILIHRFKTPAVDDIGSVPYIGCYGY
jgi:hypothetical protein